LVGAAAAARQWLPDGALDGATYEVAAGQPQADAPLTAEDAGERWSVDPWLAAVLAACLLSKPRVEDYARGIDKIKPRRARFFRPERPVS
jgi:hypothetical protein